MTTGLAVRSPFANALNDYYTYRQRLAAYEEERRLVLARMTKAKFAQEAMPESPFETEMYGFAWSKQMVDGISSLYLPQYAWRVLVRAVWMPKISYAVYGYPAGSMGGTFGQRMPFDEWAGDIPYRQKRLLAVRNIGPKTLTYLLDATRNYWS